MDEETLKAGEYTRVTKENKKILSEWRFGKNSNILDIDVCVGICLKGGNKGHNSTTGYKIDNNEFYNGFLTTEEFFKRIKIPINEINYEIC